MSNRAIHLGTQFLRHPLSLPASLSGVKVTGTLIAGVPVGVWRGIDAGDAYYSRIPAGARPNVWVATAAVYSGWGTPGHRSTNSGSTWQNGYGTAQIPELYYDGRVMRLAESPDWEAGGTGTGSKTTFEYTDDRIEGYASHTTGLALIGCPGAAYIREFAPVSAINTDTNVVTVAQMDANPTTGFPYRWANVPEELDEPGEYIIDRSSGLIYFLTPEGEDPNTKPAYISQDLGGPILTCPTPTGIDLSELNMLYCCGHGVSMSAPVSPVMGGEARGIGLVPWLFTSAGSSPHWVSPRVYDCGAQAFQVRSGTFLTASDGSAVLDQPYVRGAGRWHNYGAVVAFQGFGMTINQPDFGDGYSMGLILENAANFTINGGTIDSLCQRMGDTGFVYVGTRCTRDEGFGWINETQFTNINQFLWPVDQTGKAVAGIMMDNGTGYIYTTDCVFSGNSVGWKANGGRRIRHTNPHYDGGLYARYVGSGMLKSGQLLEHNGTIANLSSGSWTKNLTAGISIGNTTISIQAIPADVAVNDVLYFPGVGVVKIAVAASAGATSLTIAASAINVSNGTAAYWGAYITNGAVNATLGAALEALDSDWAVNRPGASADAYREPGGWASIDETVGDAGPPVLSNMGLESVDL